SRRRHTRFSRDWSSDVCSSDLMILEYSNRIGRTTPMQQIPNVVPGALDIPTAAKLSDPGEQQHRPRILILYGSLRPQSFSRKLEIGRASCRESGYVTLLHVAAR